MPVFLIYWGERWGIKKVLTKPKSVNVLAVIRFFTSHKEKAGVTSCISPALGPEGIKTDKKPPQTSRTWGLRAYNAVRREKRGNGHQGDPWPSTSVFVLWKIQR